MRCFIQLLACMLALGCLAARSLHANEEPTAPQLEQQMRQPVMTFTLPAEWYYEHGSFGSNYTEVNAHFAPDGHTALVVERTGAIRLWTYLVLRMRYWLGAVVALILTVLWWRTWRMLRTKRLGDEPYCRRCRYQLTGVAADACPECGSTNRVIGQPDRKRVLRRVGVMFAIVAAFATLVLFVEREESEIPDWYWWNSTWAYELVGDESKLGQVGDYAEMARLVQYDITTGTRGRTLFEAPGRHLGVCFSRDGAFAYVVNEQEAVKISLKTGKHVARILAFDFSAQFMVSTSHWGMWLSHDESLLYTAPSGFFSLIIWDWETKHARIAKNDGLNEGMYEGMDEFNRLPSIEAVETPWPFMHVVFGEPHENLPGADFVSFTADGFMYSLHHGAYEGYVIHQWDATRRQLVHSLGIPHDHLGFALPFTVSGDGRVLFVCGVTSDWRSDVWAWDTRERRWIGRFVAPIVLDLNVAQCLWVTSDGRQLLMLGKPHLWPNDVNAWVLHTYDVSDITGAAR